MKSILKKIVLVIITWEAKLILKKHKPFIISVTGNLGKTSTKDVVIAGLSDLKVSGSAKSMNSEFGLPLTIIGAKSGWTSAAAWLKAMWQGVKTYFKKDYAKYLILEVGADKKGDIENISKWLYSDIVVMTQFADVLVHIENFKNREELIDEKKSLLNTLKKNGIFVYNSDCKDSRNIAEEVKQKKISFGKNSGDISAPTIIIDIKNKRTLADVEGLYDYKDKKFTIERTDTVGDSSILCALPAILIAEYLKLDLEKVADNIKNMSATPGRMSILDGKEGSVIIDDSYNASPLAMEHGLKTVSHITGVNRKILILGDMLELGEYTKAEHYRIGKIAAKSGHVLITVGSRSRSIAEGALHGGMHEGWILQVDNSIDAAREVLNILRSGDLLYIKGSQSMRMEKVVKMLLAEEVKFVSKLVRQEEEWLKR